MDMISEVLIDKHIIKLFIKTGSSSNDILCFLVMMVLIDMLLASTDKKT
jgi:hypothetical protein